MYVINRGVKDMRYLKRMVRYWTLLKIKITLESRLLHIDE